MRKTMQHLDDEHMQLYEWSGAGAGTNSGIPARSKRAHAWHASYSVLALMTSLLILNGCNKGPVEQSSELAGKETEKKGGPLFENAASRPEPAESPEAAGPEMDETPSEPPAEQPATAPSDQ
jgi:hypothetical protein